MCSRGGCSLASDVGQLCASVLRWGIRVGFKPKSKNCDKLWVYVLYSQIEIGGCICWPSHDLAKPADIMDLEVFFYFGPIMIEMIVINLSN